MKKDPIVLILVGVMFVLAVGLGLVIYIILESILTSGEADRFCKSEGFDKSVGLSSYCQKQEGSEIVQRRIIYKGGQYYFFNTD